MATRVENRRFDSLESGRPTGRRALKLSRPQPNGRTDPPSLVLNADLLAMSSFSPSCQPPNKAEQPETDSEEEEAVVEEGWRLPSPAADPLPPPVLDPRDQGTSDDWIPRNPTLVRLTGKHPFNCEPPLGRLMHHGFITPAPLHYVRNHGAVPRTSWDDWTVEVCGLVRRPAKLTMKQLVEEFPARELPVTLVCAGNRRKEQNMVKQTIGFNWGAAGVSTSVWRGARLCDVLTRCGILSSRRGALNVCFEGAEDLPGGGGSKYGTSIQRSIAMDPSNDIILAYMQNGEKLMPDHGFPVRMIIPGFIGGRMVKWLRRIMVTPVESDNYYHYKDNRVLPSHVDAELADSKGWWYKPEHIINELNINSAITTPGHDDVLPIDSSTTQKPYTLRGYAYSGGGKKVTRVEVTLDGGETWLVCNLNRPEKPNKYGKYWCWCFWSLDVEVLQLLGAKEIAVRAWDQTHNTQPEKLIWNLMGMMNNCWFRVKINVCKPHRGEVGLVFEHPTLPGNQSGGWMARQKHLEMSEAAQAMKKSVSTPFMNTSAKKFTMSEVKRHCTEESAWIVIHDHVYDCTAFLKDHPGGADSILINAGADCTDEFDAIHSDKAKAMLDAYRIGELLPTGYSSSASASSSPNTSVHGAFNLLHLSTINETAAPSRPAALVPREKIPCRLVSKTAISPDVRVFRFELPSTDQVLGLPVGKHIMVSATIDGKLCIRAYTPVSPVDQVGHFDLLVRVYYKGVNPTFPKGGLMSQHLDSLPLGSTVDIKGPVGHIEYAGRGSFKLGQGKRRHAKRLAMIAGGTGITPIYQVIQAVLSDPSDETQMHLVYANRSEEGILLREELDGWARQHPTRLKVWYVVSQCGRDDWDYSVGHVTEEVLRGNIPEGSTPETLALVCGPPAMLELAVLPNLVKLGYDVKDSCLQF
ncbi:nitrate reductase [NADH] 1-like [Nymphaea colorata]|nr:nitrate reductase [NADH] 1-like [Nymphaea colorata]